jgi:hypothetical protein
LRSVFLNLARHFAADKPTPKRIELVDHQYAIEMIIFVLNSDG